MSHFVETWGYWAVALFVLAEACGVPLPGGTAVIIATTYAGHSHHLSPWTIFAVALAAALAGGQIGYVLRRSGGYRLARRWGPKIRLDESKLRTARYLFDAASAAVWAGIVSFASYVAGDAVRRTSGVITWTLVGLALVVMVVLFLLARRRAEEFAAGADAAYPAGS